MVKLRALAVAACLVGPVALTGCEIALIVAAAEDDGVKTEPYCEGDCYYYDSYCNEYVDTTASLSGSAQSSKLFHSVYTGVRAPTPLPVVAPNDLLTFFLQTEAGSDQSLDVVAGGQMTRVDDSVGACATYDGKAGIFLEIETGDEGAGSLTVMVDGAQLDRYDFVIVEPTSLDIAWDATISTPRALLRDDDGNDIYSYNGLTWEAAPTAFFTVGVGPIGPQIMWDGVTKEVELFAFYGDLSAHVTLVADSATGIMSPKSE